MMEYSVTQQIQIEIMLQKRLIFGILFSLGLVIFSSCQEKVLCTDAYPIREYYIENRTSYEIDIQGFKGEILHYIIPSGKSASTKLMFADSAYVSVGQSIIKKYYLTDNQNESNFLIQAGYKINLEKSTSTVHRYTYTFTDKSLNL